MAIRKVKINGEEHELQTTIANIDGLNNILDTTARLDFEDNENIEDASGGASANAVLYTPQTLTEAQKTQARANIGASSVNQIETLNKEKANKSGLTLGVHTDGLVYLFIDGAPHGNGLDIKADVIEGDVFGYVDENNTIVLNGSLADGTYIVKYEMENGDIVDIGNMVLDSNVYYSVAYNLTNCTINNSTKSVIKGESYSATISANDGYELKSVSVVMGGVDISHTFEDKSIINIVHVTGNIAITAVAEAKAKEPTNFIKYNATNTLDWDLFCNDARIGSDGKYRSSTSQNVTNYIPVQNGDIVYWYDMPLNQQTACLYSSDKAVIAARSIPDFESQGYIADATALNSTIYEGQLTITNASAAYIRFTILREDYVSVFEDNDGIVNIKRNGEWLTGGNDDAPSEPTVTTYMVTNNLTNCTTSNSVASVNKGNNYVATITPDDNYTLSSIVVIMGGTNISSSAVSGNIINISSVTGNIVITAVAEEVKAAYTNYAKNFETGRLRSGGTVDSSTTAATTCSDYIPFTPDTVVRVKGFGALTDYNVALYDSNKTSQSASKANAAPTMITYVYDSASGVVTLTSLHASITTIRVSGILTGSTSDVIITVNEEIV